MDPQQEIFSELFKRIKENGYDVYDGFLPPDDTSYPFVYLADSQQIDDRNKTALFGSVYQTIDVWSNNPKKRGDVSKILLKIKGICRAIRRTPDFNWDVRNIEQRILSDTTTAQPLLHGILNVEFYFD